MAINNEELNKLFEKLENLLKRQEDFSKEINSLQFEINNLKTSEPKITENIELRPDVSISITEKPEVIQKTEPSINNAPKAKSDLEKFIGENLINKIGIAITIIGVAIGAKYSIENDLVSPLTRIILAYLFGIGLLVFGMKLKNKYESYSAVLVSGAISIMYFVTYLAYSLYGFIPQSFAFILMLIFTIFTVIAALNYNKVIIAHIALVGAYAVPFLLSEGSGNVRILFSYMLIINTGILVIALKKYWKSLSYASFGFTWLIYLSWVISNYDIAQHFNMSLFFMSAFFILFYISFLAYKLIHKEKFVIDDIFIIIANSLVFFGLGYFTLVHHQIGSQLLGLFALGNAIIHFIVSAIIYRQKLADKNLFFLVTGMVLVFITAAIPIQLNGNWVTLLWAFEAALLFWIGRTKKVPFYEKLSLPLIILSFLSILHDWYVAYASYVPLLPETRLIPVFNSNFLSSLMFIVAFGFINVVNSNKKYVISEQSLSGFYKVISFLVTAIFTFTLYYIFRIEISTYWNQLYTDSALTITSENPDYPFIYWNDDLNNFKSLWIINYSLFFLSILAFVNNKRIKNGVLAIVNLGLIVITLLIFYTQGLFIIGELRDSYVNKTLSQYYDRDVFNVLIRYVSLSFALIAFIAIYKNLQQDLMRLNLRMVFDIFMYFSILLVASNELVNWMSIFDTTQSYKLGISVLWGIYSLLLIIIGIWKGKKYLRIFAISLFGITLIKLFFYDISHLNTISKTIVFVSLGVLLLIISFLYNKFKNHISNEANN